MDAPRLNRVDWLLMLLLFAGAAGARSAYLAVAADWGRDPGPRQVQGPLGDDVLELRKNLVESGSFSCPDPLTGVPELTAHTAPLLPWLLALAGRVPDDPDRFVRWVQAGLGSLSAVLYFLFCLQAFRNRFAALLAGALCALYPLWVVNAAEIQDGVLTSFLLAAALALGSYCSRRGGPFPSLLFGLTLALLALVRAPLLVFGFGAMLWFLLRCRSLPRGWLYGLLALLGFVNGLMPWTVRNYQVTGRFTPVADSLYFHLWMGSSPPDRGEGQANSTPLEVLARQRSEDPRALGKRLAELPQSERYRLLAWDLWKEVAQDPAEVMRRRLQEGVNFLLGAKWFRDGKPWEERTGGSAPPWLEQGFPSVVYGSLLALFLLGLAGWRRTFSWSGMSMPSALAVALLALPYVLGHAEPLQGPRLPLDGILLCYGAYTVASLFGKGGKPGGAA